MKKFLILVLTVFFSSIVYGQNIMAPSPWTVSVDKTTVNLGDEVTVIFKTTIADDYHIYSNDFAVDCPPQKAKLTWEKHSSFKPDRKLIPVGTHRYVDDVFECEVSDFEHKAEFRQKIKILSTSPTINGSLFYQKCNNTTGQCAQFDWDFKLTGITVNAPKEDPKVVVPDPGTTKKDPLPVKQDPKVDEVAVPEVAASGAISNVDSAILAKLNKCCGNEDEMAEGAGAGGFVSADEVNYAEYKGTGEGDSTACVVKTYEGEVGEEDNSYWGLFILAFLSGLAALLTPCVFPMIPMTVSFFMKDGSRAKAIRSGLIYGFSIIAIYVVIGTLVAAIAGPAFANWLSTHWIPNVFFFIVFVIFAASFFGAFELTLPSWLVNKADAQADKGGLTGIFFMAFTIVLVSFSCTGPIVGAILVESAGGAFIKPVVGMFGFALAFAIPFGLFAIFPSWLNGLPKSGGWLNSVKVVLGFLELALGMKFLSVADQTYHWGLLDREVYIAIWIVIFTLMGIYLLGKIKFSHDSDMPFLKVPRLLFAIATFSFVVYLIPGLIGAPLKALAGYLPPMYTHDFNVVDKILNPNNETQGHMGIKPRYNEKLYLPFGLKGYFDYEQGMEVARQMGRPVMVDFTGHGCVNCRKMEEVVWSDSKVQKLFNDEYVLISLYVDDKELVLPEEEWFYSKKGKLIKTPARQNAWIQECMFGSNAQPQYCLLDNKGNLLQPTRPSNTDKDQYIAFLKKGLEVYKERREEAEYDEN